MTNENRGLEQAKVQAASITAMVAALEVDFDRLQELRDARDDSENDNTPESWAFINPSDAEELAELEGNAGDCENEDDARERIQEDPLSVEVRSGWESGGPAVRIMGEIDRGEPCRAWIEYQDWGTPWTHAYGVIEHETLLTYCREFYFGD